MKNDNIHWEEVYNNKQPNEVSWTQPVPSTSLNFLQQFNLPKTAKIIDIGGGDSRFVDFLLLEGYENISVLDISAKALERAKQRLGDAAEKVQWIVSDITHFHPTESYDLWHDRATFHFLTTPEEIKAYTKIVEQAATQYLILATFSEKGPEKCSGLPVKQYSKSELAAQFNSKFDKISCKNEDHVTPFQTVQSFTFCRFKRHQKSAQA
jgi:trans-aconitate methyltransferase